ncbi:MAG TPA: DUF222 domain-containing protein [Actinomycetota bacterium]|nr:DUF222 domain-containing protein [Actinomycetota bacterium]
MESATQHDNRIHPVDRLQAGYAKAMAAHRELLQDIVACDDERIWDDGAARDFPHWLATELGISSWTARRWIIAAHALPSLPRLAAAFGAGSLSLDKVLDLCRFATPTTERKLITWARRVSPACVRETANVAVATSKQDAVDRDKERYLHYWWTDDQKVLALQGVLPADQGAVVAKALDRLAGRLPDIVQDDEDDTPLPEGTLDARRADALYAMCSRAIAEDQDADRATIVVQAELGALVAATSGCKIENGPVIHADTALRLCCDARLQTVVLNGGGKVVGIGRASRTVASWLQRQLRYRDGRCTFPGCEAKWFLHAHHIRHWIKGGPTDLDNLVLVCHWHHKLVHEGNWNVALKGNEVSWYRPDGRRFEPGRSPPNPSEDQRDRRLAAA